MIRYQTIGIYSQYISGVELKPFQKISVIVTPVQKVFPFQPHNYKCDKTSPAQMGYHILDSFS